MDHPVITIARQYGCGGHEIGNKVAQALGIKVYDKELIHLAAEKSGYHPDMLRRVDEQASASLLYTLATGASTIGGLSARYDIPINDKLFIVQNEIIRELANEGPCIIIGRCGDYALKDYDNKLCFFLYGDMPARVARVAKENGISEDEAEKLISKQDKKRANYYNFYTGQKWGSYERYTASFNASVLGTDKTADLIISMAKEFY